MIKTGKDLVNYRVQNNLTVKQLANKLKISSSYLYILEKYNQPFSEKILENFKCLESKIEEKPKQNFFSKILNFFR